MHTSGPGAEAAVECAQFRRFWGNKSQLRRFKDGTTCEAVGILSSCVISSFREEVWCTFGSNYECSLSFAGDLGLFTIFDSPRSWRHFAVDLSCPTLMPRLISFSVANDCTSAPIFILFKVCDRPAHAQYRSYLHGVHAGRVALLACISRCHHSTILDSLRQYTTWPMCYCSARFIRDTKSDFIPQVHRICKIFAWNSDDATH